MILRFLVVCIGLLGIDSVGGAQAATGAVPPTDRRVQPRLYSEHLNLTPGKRAWLALELTISSGWHMYWKGQNDTGLPPQLSFELPADFKVGEVLWPVPERHVAPGDLVDSIVHEQMTLLIPIDVPVNAKAGSSVTIGVKAEWLVCQESCVLEETLLKVKLPIRDTMPAAQPDLKATGVFAAARDRLPRKLPKESPPATIVWRDGSVTIDAPGATELDFHAEDGGIALESPLTEAAAKAPKLQFRLKSNAKPEQRLLGVLEIHKPGKKPDYYTVSLPQPATK